MVADVWDPEHPVLQLLRDRRRSNSKPLHRSDDARLALAVEGGGMRGVVSASMLVALEDFGFASAFDVVYGSSSGAINAAYFLLGNSWYPATIYYDDLTTRSFLDMRKFLVGKPPLSLDYAFRVVVDQVKPLDYERVINSEVPLRIAITLVDEVRTLVPSDLASDEELKAALVASSWLPFAVRGTATFRGQRAIDGGVLTAMPFWMALDDGCTHILSLSTRPMASAHRGLSALNRVTARHLERVRPGLGRGYIAAVRRKHDDEMRLRDLRISPPDGPPYVLDLAPLPGTPGVKRHELGREQLMTAARVSYEVMFAALEGRPAAAIRSGEIRAVPRLTITERHHGDSYVRLFDNRAGGPAQWGPRTREPGA
jgi:predicted patatin/cPLA2 family phospholipase